MIEKILHNTAKNMKHRVWIFSDLQQSVPENASHCLNEAVDDFRSLDMPCERIWYLGDAVEGCDIDHLEEMSEMQAKVLAPLNIPLRYVLGNHDFEYYQACREKSACLLPFAETIRHTPGWQTIKTLDSFYFTETLGDYLIVFLSDHASPTGDWLAVHGEIFGDKSKYPYHDKDFDKVKELIRKTNKTAITVSHYAFAGGNRPSNFLSRLLPLPSNVKLHFYGHAHIGDKQWAGKDCYRNISCVDNQKIPQVNVSSLENHRGNAVRSVILEIYDDGSLGICFRNHTVRRWEELYLISSTFAPWY
ncbi:MAG: metallophosphoesterase [Bacillota bacterium]